MGILYDREGGTRETTLSCFTTCFDEMLSYIICQLYARIVVGVVVSILAINLVCYYALVDEVGMAGPKCT